MILKLFLHQIFDGSKEPRVNWSHRFIEEKGKKVFHEWDPIHNYDQGLMTSYLTPTSKQLHLMYVKAHMDQEGSQDHTWESLFPPQTYWEILAI